MNPKRKEFSYTYDTRGNITSETRNGVVTTYEYDALGQLIRVNDPNDQTAEITGTTWMYAYDRGGNILHKTAYNYTTKALPETYVRRWHYTYADSNWKDKLTAFDSVPITYDAIGNPLDDGAWTYTWEKGRQLKSMHNAATGVTMEFTYNHEEIRTQKVKKVNGEVVETTDYLLYGKKIIRMKKGDNTLLFHYDEKGSPIMMRLNGTPYTYVKNLQGDVVGLIDSTGALVVEYKYDAWGNPTATRTKTYEYDALAELNPFRYRGYVWDKEIHFYNLHSRLLYPEYIRFINAATRLGGIRLLDHNLYAYCRNNPILYIDSNGYEPQIAPAPSRPVGSYKEFEEEYNFTAAGPYYYGEPFSHRVWTNSKGEWYERWYGEDGTPVMDRHWSNHGNNKEHPWVPHDEDWKDNGKSGKTIDTENARPSPPDAKKPTKATDDEFSLNISIAVNELETIVTLIFAAAVFVMSGGTYSAPAYVLP